jgi:hypothetical protein
MAFTSELKVPGDLIKSQDWNEMTTEVVRLENVKLNRAGGAITGPLTVQGALGVGTNSPDRALTIQGSGETFLNVKANNGTHEILMGADNAGGIISTMTNHDLQLRAGGNSTKLIVKADGNVGIGTTTPHAQLTLTGSIGFMNATTPMMFIYATGTNNAERTVIAHSPAFPDWGMAYRDQGDLLLFRGSGTSTMALALGSRRVGIGTDDPAVPLHVVGGRIRLTKITNIAHFVDLRADGTQLDIESSSDLFINNNNQPVHIRNLRQDSSREFKTNVSDLSSEAAISLLNGLRPVKYTFHDDDRKELHLGFVAEDVPVPIATSDKKAISPMSIIAVLTGVVRQQHEDIAALQKEFQCLKKQSKAGSDFSP